MNERIRQLWRQVELQECDCGCNPDEFLRSKFAQLIVRESIDREELLGAIARGWCHEKNKYKTMDSDLAVAIFDEVEKQIRQNFGVDK